MNQVRSVRIPAGPLLVAGLPGFTLLNGEKWNPAGSRPKRSALRFDHDLHRSLSSRDINAFGE